jgi:hypothetical protein
MNLTKDDQMIQSKKLRIRNYLDSQGSLNTSP